jgi:MFS family permease
MKLIQKKQIHYGWVIAITGMAVLFSCLGLGRFSLGMLLPSKAISQKLNYYQMGLIGTGNFVGYMISVILAGIFARLIGARLTIFLGLILVGSSMVFISFADGFIGVMVLYVATGIGSGLANVPMMGLVSHWFYKSNRGRAAGTMISGNGFAIVFTGLLIPWINTSMGAEGWRTGWLTIGIISLAISVIAVFFLRNEPSEKGLTPLGKADATPTTLKSKSINKQKSNKLTMIHLGCIYFLFGATYVVYATFIVTAMINERGFAENTAGTFWAVVGGLSIFSGPLFGWLSDRLGRKIGIIFVYTLFTISYVLVAANLSNLFLYVSIGIFGLAVWSIPTIMSAAVGDYAGPVEAVKAFGFITLFFGVGQITGPAVAGFMADITGSFNMAFWVCAALTSSAIILTYFLKPSSDS